MIDTSKIEGYAEMSAEDKVKALEAYDVEPPKADTKETDNLKTLLSKRNSEINKLQDELKARMTADERAEAERKEAEAQRQAQFEALQKERDELRKAKKVSDYKAQYLSIGFDDAGAAETAQALADGDLAKVFTNLKTLTDNIAKSAVVKAIDSSNPLTKGAPLNAADVKQTETNKLSQAMGLPPNN